ncbi:MAG: hypothetical protein LBR43_01515 [Spiroplasmataceae bacterium]|jgi:hypothetical protein|nr:hypothetical protein [Spiroplasmataceae bacterium]
MVSKFNNSVEPNEIVEDVDAEIERLGSSLSLVGDQQAQLELAEQIKRANSKHHHHHNDDFDEKENDCY